jgi:excisionase family DNA binding protein
MPKRKQIPTPVSQAPTPIPRLAWAVAEAAESLAVSRSLLYNEMKAGRLTFIKIGTRRLIPAEALTAWLAQHVA